MLMLVNIILLVLATYGVIRAADWFLGSAESIGQKLGLSSFVLGVLVVGFGTSLPELATSVAAIIDNTQNVTIANIVGSNLVNALVIIGIATFFLGTIKFEKDLIDLDLPLLFGVSVLFSILLYDGALTLSDGVILLIGFVGYVLYTASHKEDGTYHRGLIHHIANLARDTDEKGKQKPEVSGSMWVSGLILLGSMMLLAVSSKLAVDNLLEIVKELNVSVDIVTFFTIAIGTSLPELLVTFKAMRQDKGDIVLGNIIGSSIFNMLLVGGLAAVLRDQFIAAPLIVWAIVGLLLSSLMLVVNGITRQIHVWEGLIFLLIYFAIASRLVELA